MNKITTLACILNAAVWTAADTAAALRGDATELMDERLLQASASSGCTASEQSCPPGDGPTPFCTPFRSPDYCDPTESFPTLISERTSFVKENAAALKAEGWWFPQLDDKLASYVYLATGGYNPPIAFNHLFGDSLMDQLEQLLLLPGGVLSSSVVIRATNLHSNRGVYAFPTGVGGLELVRGFNMTLEDVRVDLMNVNATELIVEEFVEGSRGFLPTEYKFHVFKGEIGSVNVFYGRGSECGGCWAEVDENGERLDQYGCFTPGGSESKTGECNTIDFATGATRVFPVKGVDICSAVPEIEPCIFQDMINIAKNISMEVGVYIRVDMFVSASGIVRVQEFSTNHISGLRHCSAKLLSNGCIDSCFLGRMWKTLAANTTLGGSLEPIPSGLVDFLALSSDTERSLLVVNTVSADPVVESGCSLSPVSQTTVTLSFEGEPPPQDSLTPEFFDNVAATFRESFNFLNSENVEFCDDLCRKVISVNASILRIAPDDQRRRLMGPVRVGSFKFIFTPGFSCSSRCPDGTGLFGDDAGRRQLQSSSSSNVSSVFLPPSHPSEETCICPAEVTERRSPTLEEFTVELKARLAPLLPSPTPAPTEVNTVSEATVTLNFEAPQVSDALLETTFLESYNFLNSENVEFCDDLCRKVISVQVLPIASPDDQRRRLMFTNSVGQHPFNIQWSCSNTCPDGTGLFGDDAGRRMRRRQLQSNNVSSAVFQPSEDEACICPAEVTERRPPTLEEFTAEFMARLAPTPSPSPVDVSQSTTTVTLSFEGDPPDSLRPGYFENLEARSLETFNFLNSDENMAFCDSLCRTVVSVNASLVLPSDDRLTFPDGTATTFKYIFDIAFTCNTDGGQQCPADTGLLSDDDGGRRTRHLQSLNVSSSAPSTTACVCPVEVTERRSPTLEEFTVELNTRLAIPPTPSPTPAPTAAPCVPCYYCVPPQTCLQESKPGEPETTTTPLPSAVVEQQP